MKLKAREFIDSLEGRSIPLLEQWALRQKLILAVYREVGRQHASGTFRHAQEGAGPKPRFRLEPFDVTALGREVDDSVYAVLVGPRASAVDRQDTEAYSHLEFFESLDEVVDLCHEALGP